MSNVVSLRGGPPPPLTPADRKRARNRRHRQRLREGRVTFTGEVDEIGIAWLVAHGYLSEREASAASDAQALRAAIGKAVSELLRLSSR